MSNLSPLDIRALAWLLESDTTNPGVRYFALADLLDRPADDAELAAARQMAMSSGPVPAILQAQSPEGYWIHPGNSYLPKYRGTNWSVIFLAMLGAYPADDRVRAGGNWVLEHSRSASGRFRFGGTDASNVMIQCLEGNLCAALLELGWLGDPRLDEALEGMANSVTGKGMAPAEDRHAPLHYYRSGNSGPGFLCSGNNHLPCAWGAVKVLLALGKVPPDRRTPAVRSAITARPRPGRGRLPHARGRKAQRQLVQARLPTGLRHRCLAEPGGSGRGGLRRGPANGARPGPGPPQAGCPGPLEDGVHLQR
jgi:hypothetical protein